VFLDCFGERNIMIKLSIKTKSELFKALEKEKSAFGREDERDGILNFLAEIWDLRALPSEDPRFKDAHGDIFQHIVNNDDWSLEYLFVERLKLFQDDKIFNKFIKTIVSPKYRESEDEIIRFVLLINSYIEKEGVALSVFEYDQDEFPIYTIQKLDDKSSFVDLPSNQIYFYVVKTNQSREDVLTYHFSQSSKPAFLFIYDNWDDYTNKTSFFMNFYQSKIDKKEIGILKVTDGKSPSTIDELSDSFLELSAKFCSLGQSFDYYSNLKDVTGKTFESVLFALKDAAFFPDIHDKFENNYIFKQSLIREDEAERQLRQAKHKIYGYDLSNLYSFKYIFTPGYTKEAVEVDFDFNGNKDMSDRVFAIIGKNGTGKTQLVTTLPLNISKNVEKCFVPRSPLFSRVIAVSYSIFDDFEIPKRTSVFNYVYCGLYNIKDGKKEVLSPKQLGMRFHQTWKKIKEQKRMMVWKEILSTFMEKDIIDRFIVVSNEDQSELTVSVGEFNKIKDRLSSGQSILLYLISEIISHIRYDSLILFDEPETHLHPNAISQLMNLIYDLVKKFESYCIIATHSPLIIQELLSKNVYVMERHENFPVIRKIAIESFGENLTVLTDEVFGNREIEKQYKNTIDRMVLKGLGYEEIINELSSDDIPLSLNARLYIKSKAS